MHQSLIPMRNVRLKWSGGLLLETNDFIRTALQNLLSVGRNGDKGRQMTVRFITTRVRYIWLIDEFAGFIVLRNEPLLVGPPSTTFKTYNTIAAGSEAEKRSGILYLKIRRSDDCARHFVTVKQFGRRTDTRTRYFHRARNILRVYGDVYV